MSVPCSTTLNVGRCTVPCAHRRPTHHSFGRYCASRSRADVCRALPSAEPAASAANSIPPIVTQLSAAGLSPTPAPQSSAAASPRSSGVAASSTAVEVLFPPADFAAAPLVQVPVPADQLPSSQTLWSGDEWPGQAADTQSMLSAFGGLALPAGSDLPAMMSRVSSTTAADRAAVAERLDVKNVVETGASMVWLAFRAYSDALEERPIMTKAATAFVTFLVGDVIAQHTQHAAAVDMLRVLRQGSYGLMDGPVGHFWYNILDKHVFPEEPTAMKSVVAKTAADQLVWSPIMTCVFFAYLSILQGCPAEILPTIQHKLLPTLAANYAYWPLVHLVNFRYVPNKYRIPYNSLLCIVWTTYLSWSSHNSCGMHG